MDFFFFLLFVFRVCLSLLAALWSPAGKGLTSKLSCMWCFLVCLLLSYNLSMVSCGT